MSIPVTFCNFFSKSTNPKRAIQSGKPSSTKSVSVGGSQPCPCLLFGSKYTLLRFPVLLLPVSLYGLYLNPNLSGSFNLVSPLFVVVSVARENWLKKVLGSLFDVYRCISPVK